MTQYRLLDTDSDVIEVTDEFWDAVVRKWKVVPRDFIGERFYAVIPYRRAIPEPEPVTRKVVLKEYLERYGEHYRTEWHNGNVENCKGAGFIMPDESWPTGQEREIEIPA